MSLSEITIPDSVTEIGSNAFASTGIRLTSPDLLPGSFENAPDIRDGSAHLPDLNGLNLFPADENGVFAGNLYAIMPGEIRTGDPAAADAALIFRYDYEKRDDYIGEAYDTLCKIYLCRQGVEPLLVSEIVNFPSLSGFGTLRGPKPGTDKIWERLSKLFITEIIIPDTVTEIGNFEFYGYAGLRSVSIPSSVTRIGDFAFDGCSGLTELVIPNSVTWIGHRSFEGCSGITELIIPDSVTSLGDGTFRNCTGLTRLSMPSSLSYLNNPFYGCGALSDITIRYREDERTAKWKDIISSCDSERTGYTLTLTGPLEEIDKRAFHDLLNLRSVILPDTLVSIGEKAFSGCTGLVSVTVPPSVTDIAGDAFNGCPEDLQLIVTKGSYAKQYAAGHGFRYAEAN